MIAERMEARSMRDAAVFWFIVCWFLVLPVIGLWRVLSWVIG